jgi:hypothetical protein
MPEFFQTMMGRIFYTVTMPELSKQLKRIADVLEAQEKREQVIIDRLEEED